MKVTFDAQVKQLTSRVSGTNDKSGRMVIEFNIYDDELVGQLAKFVTVDAEIKVTVEKE